MREKITLIEHAEISEIIPRNIEIKIGNDSVVFIYEPIACHSYNKIEIDQKQINIATIDTLLSFYLAFLYSKKEYYKNKEKIMCMAMFLFDVQQRNRLSQKGLLKRFSIDCYGKQKTLEDIRTKKAEKFKELITKKGTNEYDEWFLKYNPNDKRKNVIVEKNKNVSNEIILSQDAMKEKIKKQKSIKQKSIKQKSIKQKSIKQKSIKQKSIKQKSIKRKNIKRKNKTEKKFLF